MKIVITCVEAPSTKVAVNVYALSYDGSKKAFSMPCPYGDNWLHRLGYELESHPVEIHLQWDEATISFKNRRDAEAFEAWLRASEKQAQEGYTTMRG